VEQKTSIKEKLNIITLWITGAVFASAFITLVIFNKAMAQKELAWNLTILSKVMATNVDSSQFSLGVRRQEIWMRGGSPSL